MPILKKDPTYPWLVNRGQIYYVEIIDKRLKRRKWFSTRLRNRQRAIDAGTEILGKYFGIPTDKRMEPRCPTFRELGEKIKEELRVIRRAGTVHSFSNSMDIHLYPYFGTMVVVSIKREDWIGFVARRRSVQSTVALFNDWKWFRRVMHRARIDGHTRIEFEIENPGLHRKRSEETYTTFEVEGLKSSSGPDGRLHIDLYVIQLMRSLEQCKAKFSHVDFDKGTIHIPTENAKTKKSRTIPLDPLILEMLRVRKTTSKSDWIFPSRYDYTKHKKNFRSAFRYAKKKAGITFGTPHRLRHTSLTHKFAAVKGDGNGISTDAVKICAFAGLSLNEAIKTYLHLTPEDLREVVSGTPSTKPTGSLPPARVTS